MTQTNTDPEQPGGTKLVARMAARFGVDENKLVHVLKATVFSLGEGKGQVTTEQLMMLMVIAEEHNLNPFTREIYAFPDKTKGVVPIVSVDGWARIINSHPQYDGVEFEMQPPAEWGVYKALNGAKPCPDWMECKIFRKDRGHPTVIREFLDEVYRPPFKPHGKNYEISGPWQSHIKRFFRHKTLIQCARLAFSFSGIYDEDEGRRILEGEAVIVHEPATPKQAAETLRAIEGDAPKALTADTRANALDDLLSGQINEGANKEPVTIDQTRVDEFEREMSEADAEASA